MSNQELHEIFKQRRATLVHNQRVQIQEAYKRLQGKRHSIAHGHPHGSGHHFPSIRRPSVAHHILEEDEDDTEHLGDTLSQSLIPKSTQSNVRFEAIDKRKEETAEFLEGYVSSRIELAEDVKVLSHHEKVNHEHMKRLKILGSNPTQFRSTMYDFVESKYFGAFILSIIMMNTAILVTQTWEIVSVRGDWYFSAIDNAFLGIYIMECVLKIFVFRKFYFYEGWNILDVSIVVFNLVDFTLPLIISNMSGFNGAAIFRLLRIFRAIRAIRALRVLRTIRFLSHLQVIMTTCLQSIQSMGAIVGLMMLFLYMFAVIGRGLYFKYDHERFGSLLSAAFTLFQLLTLDDWFYIYQDTVKKMPSAWHIILYLLLYIVVEYFIFLNLFVAVLVDNFQLTLEAANEAKKKKKKHSEDSDEEEDYHSALEESTESSGITELSSLSVKMPRKNAEEYFPKLNDIDNQLLSHHFQLMASLEYNTQFLNSQQKTVDIMVDMCAETQDDV